MCALREATGDGGWVFFALVSSCAAELKTRLSTPAQALVGGRVGLFAARQRDTLR